MTPLRHLLLLTTLILCTSEITVAQTHFQKLYGGEGNELARTICRTPDDGFILVGPTTSGGAGLEDVCLVKLTATGDVVWVKTYGSTEFDYPVDAYVTPDSCILVTGYYVNPGHGWDMFLMKIAQNGELLWSKRYGGYGDEVGEQIVAHPAGGYLIVATGTSFGGGGWDGWLMRVDDDGNILWFRTYGSWNTEQFYNAVVTQDGGFIVVGHTYGFGVGMHDAVLMKTTQDGTYQWMRTYGTSADDGASVVMQTPDGGYLIGGNTHGGAHGDRDNMIVRVDTGGNVISSASYGTAGDDTLPWGEQIDATRMAVVGWMTAPDGSLDGWFSVVNENGSIQRSWRYGGTNTDRLSSFVAIPGQSFVMAGMTSSGTAKGEDFFIVHADSTGATEVGTYPGANSPATLTLTMTSPAPILNSYEPTPGSGPSFVDSLTATFDVFTEIQTPLVFVPSTFGHALDTVSIPVILSNPYGVAGGDISVVVDTSVLLPVNVRRGTLIHEFALAFNLSRPDSILISFARAEGLTSNEAGSILIIECEVRPDVPDSTETDITLPSVTLYDASAETLDCTVEGGVFSTSSAVKGDVNANGLVNAGDAIVCLQFVAEETPAVVNPTAFWAADIDDNGAVTSFDAFNILRMSVGLQPIGVGGDYPELVRIIVPPFAALAGSVGTVPITILGIPDLVSGTLEFGLPDDAFQVEAIHAGPAFPGIVAKGEMEDGVRVAFASGTAWGQQDAVVASMTVKALVSWTSFLPHLRSASIHDRFGRKVNTFQLSTSPVDDEPSSPLAFRLSANYPNPFNPSTRIAFELPQAGHARLVVHDLLGREVRTLLDGPLSAGTHEVVFEANGLPSGVYFYTLTSGSSLERKRMVLMK